MIRFDSVTKHLGGRNVLDRVSIDVDRGEIVFVLGRSGAGKSVLLRHLVGLMKADSGRIEIDGTVISDLSEEEWAPIRKRCGMVFQYPALFDFLDVEGNIIFADQDTSLRRVEEVLDLTALDKSILRRSPRELSFGEQKRVAVARALVAGPEYLLFDEPTTGLDPVSARHIDRLIAALRDKTKLGSIVVSHDISAALEIADRICFLDRGKIVIDAPPREVRKSAIPLLREFVAIAEEERKPR